MSSPAELARPLRVVVTGGECTGKTTMAGLLAERFGGVVVPEASRLYAERKVVPLDASDVEPIAREQMALEEAALSALGSARIPRPLLVLDADLVSTVVYSRHYYGHCAPWIEAAARARLGDLYLLQCPDVPWVADGVRDQPDAREEVHAAFEACLRTLNAKVTLIEGEWAKRYAAACNAVALLGVRSLNV